MAKKEPKTKTYKLTRTVNDEFYRVDLYYETVNSIALCASSLERMFHLNGALTIELTVSNIRPKGNNFHFLRKREDEFYITGLATTNVFGGTTQYLPCNSERALREDFPGAKTLYLWCY